MINESQHLPKSCSGTAFSHLNTLTSDGIISHVPGSLCLPIRNHFLLSSTDLTLTTLSKNRLGTGRLAA